VGWAVGWGGLGGGVGSEIIERNRHLARGLIHRDHDSKKPMIPPGREVVPSVPEFAPLEMFGGAAARSRHYIKRWHRRREMAARVGA